jgi:hypothetical protein
MIWQVPKIWEGGDVWILGGGPSITKLFGVPDNIVQQVLVGKLPVSAYSPYLAFLHDKHVIGINASFEIGDWIDMVFFGDTNFFERYAMRLSKFPNLKVTCSKTCRKTVWVKYLIRDTKKYGISNNPRQITWNSNSGAAAISLAVHTGAKRIFLLGFDMQLVNGEKHWHRIYSKGQAISPRRPVPFKTHLVGFPKIKQDAAALGVELYNVNPTSAITCLPKLTLQEAMQL